MQRSKPFGRALHMIALIGAAMSLAPAAQAEAMSNIGPYESRGKGRGGSGIGRGRHGAGMAAVRAARKLRNVKRHRKACRG